MLQSYEGADGLKTGYTIASGFNLATSAQRGNTRLIGVVLGASSSGERDLHMASLLDQGFDQSGEAPVFVQREPTLPVLVAAATAAPAAALARTMRGVARPLAARAAAGPAFRPRALAAPRAPASRTTTASAPVQRAVARASRTDRVEVARRAVPERASERARVHAIRAAVPKPVKAAVSRPQPAKAGTLRLPSTGRIRG